MTSASDFKRNDDKAASRASASTTWYAVERSVIGLPSVSVRKICSIEKRIGFTPARPLILSGMQVLCGDLFFIKKATDRATVAPPAGPETDCAESRARRARPCAAW